MRERDFFTVDVLARMRLTRLGEGRDGRWKRARVSNILGENSRQLIAIPVAVQS